VLRSADIQEGTMQLGKFVKFRKEQFGGVLFETRSEKVFTLNETGAAIIGELVAGAEPATIADRLRARFQDPDNTLENDVAALIAELQSKGLLAESPPA